MRYMAVAGIAVFAVGCREASGQQRPAEQPGRYQIVNGTPQITRNIMLLDTQVGRSWVICSMRDSTSGWCPMPIGDAAK